MHDLDLMLELQLKGKNKEAREISDKLEALGPEGVVDNLGKNSEDVWIRHCFNRGWFLIQDGDYQKGCHLLEHGRFINVYGSPPLRTDAPIYNPQIHNLQNKSIIVSLEGGFGDEIIHARFATTYKKLGAKNVYLAAAPELVSVFSRIEGIDGVILRNQAHTVQHDYWVPGFSSGWVAGHTFDNFPSKPYLYAKQESVEVWKAIINSEKKKIGIRWAGNPKFEHQQFRRFPENFITNLVKYKDIQLYSLQRDNNIIQLPEGIIDLQHFLLSWEDTMAAIQNMDLIITSCTSIAHLSAAMGKETWVIVPILPYHTWTSGSPNTDRSPYYECVRIFRQEEYKLWNTSFQKLYSKLEEKYNLEKIEMPNEDKITKRLNLGCGFNKVDSYVNVDKSELVQPDEIVDLDIFPWKWKDDEFEHIVAKDILEHIGKDSNDFVTLIKEMYRITSNGGIWEIQFPHWRCDIALDDPTHKRLITFNMFNLFNKKFQLERIKSKESDSLISFENDIDIEICDINIEYTQPYKMKIEQKQITSEELDFHLNHFNNVALSIKLLIQVHKPGRFDLNHLKNIIGK